MPRNGYRLIPLTQTIFSQRTGDIQRRNPEGGRALSCCQFPQHSAHVDAMAFKPTGWDTAKILLLFELQVRELCQRSLTFTLPAKFRIEWVFIHIHCVCSHTLNLSTPANQLDCVLNIKYVASKAFGHSGLLMSAFYFRPVILIPSLAFICIFVMLSLVLYTQTESLVFNLLELKLGEKNTKTTEKKYFSVTVTNQQ